MASSTTSPPPAGGTTSNTNCSACGSVARRPHLACFECTEGFNINGDVDSIQYCTARCRDLAAADHKNECEKRNVRKQIYRAGELLQSVFYRSQDLNFLNKIISTTTQKGVVYFRSLPLGERKSVFESSPYKLVSSINRAHALMSSSKCSLQMSTQFELSQKLLTGIVKYIEEVAIDAPNDLLKVRYVFPNGTVFEPQCTHQVLCVETHAREAYMFDITGAQFGQYKPVLPLQEALNFYGNKVNVVRPHGHYRATRSHENILELAGGTGRNPRNDIIPMFLAGLFDKRLANWEAAARRTAGSYLGATRQVFEQLKSAVLDIILEASVEGRQVLKKVSPRNLAPSLQVPADDLERLNKQVDPFLRKSYEGSRIGQACHLWKIEQIKNRDPMAWECVLAPHLAAGGVIPTQVDRDYKKREAIAKYGKADNNPSSIEVLDILGQYWADRTLNG